MLRNLLNDDYGVIISAELVFVLTILVIGMVVGLSEVQHAVVQELDDISNAIGHVNQSYGYTGFSARKFVGAETVTKNKTAGSAFEDGDDDCDSCDGHSSVACDEPESEDDCDN